MWVGTRVGTRSFVGTSVGSLLFVGFLLLFGLVGMPIMIGAEIVRSLPGVPVGVWVVVGVLAAAAVVWVVWYLATDEGTGYMSPEERAAILAQYPDPDQDEPVRLRPNRLRQPR